MHPVISAKAVIYIKHNFPHGAHYCHLRGDALKKTDRKMVPRAVFKWQAPGTLLEAIKRVKSREAMVVLPTVTVY